MWVWNPAWRCTPCLTKSSCPLLYTELQCLQFPLPQLARGRRRTSLLHLHRIRRLSSSTGVSIPTIFVGSKKGGKMAFSASIPLTNGLWSMQSRQEILSAISIGRRTGSCRMVTSLNWKDLCSFKLERLSGSPRQI